MRPLLPLVAAAALAAVAACLPREVVQLRTEPLADGLTFLRGGGGNSLVLIRGERALVFDSKLWPWGADVARVIASAGARPTLLVNSHLHGDHAGANGLFAGATLVASRATIEHLDGARRVPSAAPSLPVSGRMPLQLGGETVVIGALPAAHTGSDVFAYFPRRRLVATGDVFVAPFYPHADALHGGRWLGLIAALDELVSLDAEVVIPGHGPQTTQAELVAYRNHLRALRDEIVQRRARGEDDVAIAEAVGEAREDPYQPMDGISSRSRLVRGLIDETRAKP